MSFRILPLLVCLAVPCLAAPADDLPLGRTPAPAIAPAPAPAAAPANEPLIADEEDPTVIRAREGLARVQELVKTGALPRLRLKKAQEDLQDALDMSLLRKTLYSNDLTPDQTDQMIAVAERMVARRQRVVAETQSLVASGVISRSEGEVSSSDLLRAQKELDWAQARARLVQQLAETIRIEKGIASLEMQFEQHPDWVGSVAEKYSGNGVFTSNDLQKVEVAYVMKFGRTLPISANGETAVHRSFGFDHRGRVDVAVNPDQPEGVWLRQYLTANRIPYFAFRMAVAHKATGAHIHIGPQSTRLALNTAR